MVAASRSSDSELWTQVQRGETEAFAELYDRHVHAVHKYAFRMTGMSHDAEDLTSKTFLTLWDRRHKLEAHGSGMRPVLYGIVTNHARNRWRKVAGSRLALRRLASQREIQPDSHDVAAHLDAANAVRAVLEQTRELPRGERDALELFVLGELSYDQVAEALKIPVGTVRSRIARARSRLGPRTDLDIAT